jgi:hypothetical protein
MLLLRLKIPTVAVALALLAVTFTAAHAQTTPEAAVTTFMEAFNSGDMARAATVNSASGTNIIDEFAPFTWSGPTAFADWGAGFAADATALGITEPKVMLNSPIVKNLIADHAYLIYPAVYTYKLKGVSMREPAHMAFALRKEGSDWKIAAWTWTGTVPKPAK